MRLPIRIESAVRVFKALGKFFARLMSFRPKKSKPSRDKELERASSSCSSSGDLRSGVRRGRETRAERGGDFRSGVRRI